MGVSCLMVHMGPQSRTVEQILDRIGSRQHGIVTRREALAAGISSKEIKGRLRKGSLLRMYPGVYRIGHRAPSTEARYLGAVRACGEGALLGGQAAGFVYRLIRGPEPVPEVITPTQRRVRGVITRRTRAIHPLDATTWRGIPVTTVPRTLVDLAAVLGPDDLARACHEAAVRFGTTPAQVEAVLERRPSSPGRAKLMRVLRGDQPVTLSALERRFLRVLREAGLPLPETNRPASGRRVDCRWPDYALTVELDSYRYHSSRHAWERDRRREREAHARGDQFRRYTYGDVFEDSELMLAELRSLVRPAVLP
jgi:hypothetical protein